LGGLYGGLYAEGLLELGQPDVALFLSLSLAPFMQHPPGFVLGHVATNFSVLVIHLVLP
jgi:hypothetical protein